MLKPGTKRFYAEVVVRAQTDAFAVLLDGRQIKTPAGATMLAPTRALADAIAAEWAGQGETLLPDTMPLTKALNTALDRIAANRQVITDDLAKYAGSDLLCYRADAPQELARRQAAAWDRWLAWADERFGATLRTTEGVGHVEQEAEALARLRAAIAAHDNFQLVALHAATTITGSAVLGLAFAARALSADAAFSAAHVDETYQAELWGRDPEAEKARTARLADLKAAERFLTLLA